MMGSSNPRDFDKALRILAALTDPEAVKAEGERLAAQSAALTERTAKVKKAEDEAEGRLKLAAEREAAVKERIAEVDKASARFATQKQQLDSERAAVNIDKAKNDKAATDLAQREREMLVRQNGFDAANEAAEKRVEDMESAIAVRAAMLDEREDALAKAERAYESKRAELNRAISGL